MASGSKTDVGVRYMSEDDTSDPVTVSSSDMVYGCGYLEYCLIPYDEAYSRAIR